MIDIKHNLYNRAKSEYFSICHRLFSDRDPARDWRVLLYILSISYIIIQGYPVS